jgi:hypothetical protein
LKTRALLANHKFAAFVDTYKVKDGLTQIDTDGTNLHGTPPLLTSTPSWGFGGGPCQ